MTRKNNNNNDDMRNINTKDPSLRIEIVEKYIGRKITARKIAIILNIKVRRAWYLIKNYKEKEKLFLIHGLKNKPSNHSIEKEKKEKVIELIKQDKYKDFGPTLLSEYLLEKEHMNINHETLGRLMNNNKLQTFKRKRKPYGTKRERKECFGDMLQIDDSFHRRFDNEELKEEDKKACLINLIDDNSNTNLMLFDKQETMVCACRVLWLWICKYGIPQSICCDRRNMYVGGGNKDKEKTELNNPKGYFRTMCDNLGINIMEANSPQAKGRIERSNKTHQDRLVKALRII
jgi:hypothetical protein